MDKSQLWAGVVGFFSPVLLAFIQQTPWKTSLKAVVTFLWSVIVGLVTTWLAGKWNGTDVVANVLIVLVTAIATFHGLWKPQMFMTALERKTSYWPKTGPVV